MHNTALSREDVRTGGMLWSTYFYMSHSRLSMYRENMPSDGADDLCVYVVDTIRKRLYYSTERTIKTCARAPNCYNRCWGHGETGGVRVGLERF